MAAIYDPSRSPNKVTAQINHYVDWVMNLECTKKVNRDKWTLDTVLSLGDAKICKTCDKNRETLLNSQIPKWIHEYSYNGVVRRGVTEYRDLPGKIKTVCGSYAVKTIDYITDWTPDNFYEYGKKLYMREILTIPEIVDLGITNAINERNIDYLTTVVTDLKYELSDIKDRLFTD